jgi:CDP-paratose synthetase
LGSALALHLRKAGHEVALLLRPSSKTRRLQGLESSFVIGRHMIDCGLTSFVKHIRPEIVIHTACAYGRSGESITQLLDVNVRLGLAILDVLMDLNYPFFFINAGSALPASTSDYAISKQQFSDWGRLLADRSDGKLKFVDIKLHQMYGPGDDPSKFVMYVLQTCRQNARDIRLTLGEQSRDFIYIDDVVEAFKTLITHLNLLDVNLELEIGSGEATSVRKFVEIAHGLLKSQTKLLFGAVPYRINEPMHLVAQISRMNQLGWKPQINIYEGLKKTIQLEFNSRHVSSNTH